MTTRILARNVNTVTCCRRLSRDCFGDVLHNREVLQHVILAKKPYERRLRGATPILYVILVRKPRNERPRYGLST